MKKILTTLFKLFIIGFSVLFAIEVGAFLFLDKVYLKDNATYKSQIVTSQASARPKQIRMDTGTNITNIQCSFEGNYVSYLNGNTLTLIDTTNGSKFTVPETDNMQIMDYQWIYDRDRVIIAEKPAGSASGSYLKLFYYNTSDKVKTEIDNAENKQVLTIPLKSSSTQVSHIDMSTLTNLTYLKLTGPSGSQIYKIDVNVTRSLVSTVTSAIGNIAAFKNDSTFLYEDTKSGDVYKAGSSKAVSVAGHKSLKLLGNDANDIVYLAVPTTGTTTSLIYYGNLAQASWNHISLTQASDLSSISVGMYGGIYENDSGRGTLTNLMDNTTSAYKGQLLGIYQGGFISEQNGIVLTNHFTSNNNQTSTASR